MSKIRIVGLDLMVHKNEMKKKAHLVIITWLNAMIKGYKSIVHPLSKYTVPLLQPEVPQQVNGFDCGVYCLQFAEIAYKKIEEYSLTDHQDDHLTRVIADLFTNVNQRTISNFRRDFLIELQTLNLEN